jgi:transketolase C-terminal domain/subunit
MIRTYLDYENINVKLVGVGRNKDYVNMGKSHWADDDERIMSSLLTLRRIRPSAEDDMSAVVKDLFETSGPAYINLLRT